MDQEVIRNRRDLIVGLGKGLLIIEAFNDAHPRLSASTAARRTGISRTAARRYLLTLQHLGYLESDGQMFWLTPRVLRLGWSYFDSAKIPRAIQPYLQRVSVALGCMTFFSILDDFDVVFVSRDGSSRIQSVGYVLGARVSAGLLSAGIAMLSCRPPEEIEKWLETHKFISYTSYTITSADGLRELIDTARVKGYAVVEQQLTPGIRGIAVPIRKNNGVIVGAINVSLPMANESIERAVGRTLPLLREVEQAILASF